VGLKSGAIQNRWLVLGLIWLVFVVHGIDRSVLLVLLEPIRKNFNLDDSQIGLLIGLGYAAPFALAGIPLGAMVDRVPKRKYFLAGLLAVWSCLTMLGGLAPSYAVLVLTRAFVGATEAGAPPTMMSILSDSFDVKTRPVALSVYYTAPFLGLMVGAIFAGDISQLYGWRVAVLAIGAPGILMAIVTALFLREPVRGRFDEAPAAAAAKDCAAGPATPVGRALLYAVRDPQLRRLLIAMVLGGFVLSAISSWAPVLMERVLGFSQHRAGGLMALVFGLPAVTGSLAGGAIMSRFGKGEPQRLLRFCGIILLISAPLAVLAPLCGSAEPALILLFWWAFFSCAYLGPAWSVIIMVIPPPMRGTIMGLGIVLSNLVGPGFGPQTIGLVSDLLHGLNDAAHLQHAMSGIALFTLIPALLFFSSAMTKLPSRNIAGSIQTEHF
jgi:predicted MFS family arabinose efflux permease